MMNKAWLKAALIRAVRTMAQTAIATIGAAAAISEVNWTLVASYTALAGILAVLTAIAGLPEVNPAPDLAGDLRGEEADKDGDLNE